MMKLIPHVLMMLIAGAAYAGDGSVHRAGNPVPNTYVVLLDEQKQRVDPGVVATEFANKHGIKVELIYGTVLKGFSFRGSEAMARAISANPRVVDVRENERVYPQLIVQSPAPSWGLDRIDQVNLPLDRVYREDYTG
ncbi:MAG: hypothetical protein ACREMY_10395, partial [bacterium]